MASVVRWPECQNCKDQSAKRRSSPHWRGRTPAEHAGRVGLARGPRRASRSAHASGQPRELRSPRPRASPAKITLLKGATASPEPPRTSPGAKGGWRSWLGPALAPRPSLGMEPDSSPSRSWGPGTRDLEPTASGGAGTLFTKPPPLPDTTRLGPSSERDGAEKDSGAAKWGSGLEQQDPDPGERMGSGREEEKREGAAENPKAGLPPPGGTVPPPLPARDQLPSCSKRKNPSRPCSSVGTTQSARAPRPQTRHSAAPHASLPRHRTSRARSRRDQSTFSPSRWAAAPASSLRWVSN